MLKNGGKGFLVPQHNLTVIFNSIEVILLKITLGGKF